jgi:hypothetical protein
MTLIIGIGGSYSRAPSPARTVTLLPANRSRG